MQMGVGDSFCRGKDAIIEWILLVASYRPEYAYTRKDAGNRATDRAKFDAF